MTTDEKIYLLFYGTSPDGRGQPLQGYVGRTSDKIVAREHFEKIHSDPYAFGSVFICTEKEFKGANEFDLM